MRARRRPGRLLVGWVVLWALWMLFVGEWTWLVAVWGAGLALVASGGAALAGHHELLDAEGRLAWVRELGSAAVAVVTDFAVDVAALARAMATGQRRIGAFREDTSAAGSDPLAVGRRSWVAFVATWSPNAYVVDISPQTGRRLLHALVPRRSSEQPS